MYRRETPTIFASLSFSKHANSMAQDPNLVSIGSNPNQPFGVDWNEYPLSFSTCDVERVFYTYKQL